MIQKAKLLMPTIGTRKRVISGAMAKQAMQRLQAKGKFTNQQIWEMLGDGTFRIRMQARGIDTIGTNDLKLYKDILRHMGADSYPGLPATNVFCINQQWEFEITRADNPDVVEFVSEDFGVQTQSEGHMELRPLKGGYGINWILGHAFRLRGIKFTCLPANDAIKQGGLESSNMVIGAATATGSILTGVDWDLGTIFTEATRWENDVLGGLTGGQGLAAGILGGAHSVEWAVHIHPYGGMARKLFGHERYGDFEEHVSFLLPVSKDSNRASVDINEIWTQNALTPKGMKIQSIFTYLSQEAAAGYSNPGKIDWIRIATAVQEQTDIRTNICPAYLGGVENLAKALIVRKQGKVLRAIARPGAGGSGTPLIVYSTTEKLAREADDMVADKLDYRLSAEPIRFEGFKEAGFNNPEPLVEIDIEV